MQRRHQEHAAADALFVGNTALARVLSLRDRERREAARRTQSLAAATPLAPSPTTTTRLPDSSDTGAYRNFKLERPQSAKRMEMIQKRTMILGSAHPFFS